MTGTAPEAEPGAPGVAFGTVVAGLIIALVGVGWLLESLDVTVPWRGLLPAALILVGASLAIGAHRGRHGGLIALGAALTVIILLISVIEVVIDIPWGGGIGETRITADGPPESEYRWGVGSMTLDLRSVEVGDGETIAASVVVGEMIVIVPDHIVIDIDARSGIGEVVVFGEHQGGVGAEAADVPGSRADLILDLDVAIGRIEVRR
ncbi:hypothetical protein HQ535_16730 [bacterium]|nr:hypothetical protein [bacterium]